MKREWLNKPEWLDGHPEVVLAMLLKDRVREAINNEWEDNLNDMVDRYSFKIEITIRNLKNGSIAERVVTIP
ncbi:MAG: hypothetical protein AMJ54_11015 [Deltaproteobacteria bacterium SG8_13]|nr:MAG: hypothetical protein AMJ54_11015 [Deltaproteobacteria bacterium SG8_13]